MTKDRMAPSSDGEQYHALLVVSELIAVHRDVSGRCHDRALRLSRVAPLMVSDGFLQSEQ
ncbi:MAG: hypothetical protein AB7R40_06220 [Nitrospiraceae bacterium]